MYFRGQGKVFVASVTNGVPGAFRYLGNVPELNVGLETETEEHAESTSGQSLIDLRLLKQKSASFKATLEEFSKENLALVLYGAHSTIDAGTVTAEPLPTGLVAGDYARLTKPKVSSVVVKDSAGTPATLTPGTDYEVASANHGTLKILNVGTYVQPFKVDYSNAQVTNINMFTQAQPEVFLRFEGLNVAGGNAPVLVELYRVAIDPAAALDLITTEIMKFELAGSVLYDETKAADAVLGAFGRIVQI